MKHKNLVILAAATTLLVAGTSCSKKLQQDRVGDLSIQLSSESFFDAAGTKAVDEGPYKDPANYTIVVTDANTQNTILNCKVSELDAEGCHASLKNLEFGSSYNITAFYVGNEINKNLPYSKSDFYVEGKHHVTIDDVKKPISIICTPTCGKVNASFDANMATYYDEYYIKMSGTKAMTESGQYLTFSKTDTDPWYIWIDSSAPNGSENINFEIYLKVKEQYQHMDSEGKPQREATLKGTFPLQRNKSHRINVKANYTPSSTGDLGISITIDDTTIDREVNIDIPLSWI